MIGRLVTHGVFRMYIFIHMDWADSLCADGICTCRSILARYATSIIGCACGLKDPREQISLPLKSAPPDSLLILFVRSDNHPPPKKKREIARDAESSGLREPGERVWNVGCVYPHFRNISNNGKLGSTHTHFPQLLTYQDVFNAFSLSSMPKP